MSIKYTYVLLQLKIIVMGSFLFFNLPHITLSLDEHFDNQIKDPRLKNTEGICEDAKKMRHYLQNGGDPNLKINLLVSSIHSGGGDWYRRNPLVCSVIQSDEDNIKILIDKGAEVNYVIYSFEEDSFSALDRAIRRGNLKITKLLIDAGANINISQEELIHYDRKAPIFIAVEEGHREIVKLLIAHQVNINIQDERGETPFDYTQDKVILDLLNEYNAVN